MVTALHEVGDLERAHECGTDDFLTKPVNKLELLLRVRSLLPVRLLKKHVAALQRQLGIGAEFDPRAADESDLADTGLAERRGEDPVA
jgi:DNA-binding response OmpR family regulator